MLRWTIVLVTMAWSAAASAAAPVRTACDPAPASDGLTTFDNAKRILEVRIVHADAGPPFDGARCVALELELVDEFRGSGPEKLHDHLHVTVRQSTITSYRDRPAGAWWVIEQELAADRELIAFCPKDSAAADQLREACVVVKAEPGLVADLALAREAERAHLDQAALLVKARSQCAGASYVLADLVWSHRGSDLASFAELATLLEEPACSRVMRATLLDHMYSDVIATGDPPRTRRLALALFRLLAMPEASDLHDNLVAPYLPNLLGLTGGHRHTAAGLLDKDGRRVAQAALDAYKGPVKTDTLRAWLRR
jgi:hypothetical protein